MNYRTIIELASKKLEAKNLNPQNAIFLMLELSNKQSYDLYLHYDEEVEQSLQLEFDEKMQRLLNNEPLQQILGYEYFYGNKLFVNQDVLIPREETQELVSNVLADIDEYFKEPVVIDVGCGSGAIAVTLKSEEPSITMYASDISEKALEVAKRNAELLNVDVTFFQGDMLEPFIANNIKVDILVSNPPYIKQHEHLDASVVDFEPHIALFGGEDGLYFYHKILSKAHFILNEKFIIAFEMGYDQKDSLMQLAKQYYPHCNIEVVRDIHGKDRMLFIYNV